VATTIGRSALRIVLWHSFTEELLDQVPRQNISTSVGLRYALR
jgi:hypothetical protein